MLNAKSCTFAIVKICSLFGMDIILSILLFPDCVSMFQSLGDVSDVIQDENAGSIVIGYHTRQDAEKVKKIMLMLSKYLILISITVN